MVYDALVATMTEVAIWSAGTWCDGTGTFRISQFDYEMAHIVGGMMGGYLFFNVAASGVQGAGQIQHIQAIRKGSLSNVAARDWYLGQLSQIKGNLNTSQSLQNQARQAFDMRNAARTNARLLMSDRALAQSLNMSDPNFTWGQIITKYQNKGFRGDALWREIIDSSMRSNPNVNQMFGIR